MTLNIKSNPAPLPPPSSLQEYLASSHSLYSYSTEQVPTHLRNLAHQIQQNLQYQHGWSQLIIHDTSPLTQKLLHRPMIAGRPPSRVYIHPDEQIELLKHEPITHSEPHTSPDTLIQNSPSTAADMPANTRGDMCSFTLSEREWILPTHVAEHWSLKDIADIFDSIGNVPPAMTEEEQKLEWEEEERKEVGWQWRGSRRQKRLLMATVHDDSTIVYYIIHDGIVKPRQN